MKPLLVLLVAVVVVGMVLAAEESCVGRCENGFNPALKCQCDDMCKYYSSCCLDYDTICGKKARGDTFANEDDGDLFNMTTPSTIVTPTTHSSTRTPDPDAVTCSGRPFDAFMQLKNGSIYAFRGKYFFELDEHAVVPGYSKLIEDMWGIPGPIDAAFTRINCQGKTYIFKGNKYWRFEGNVLDEDYPRDIGEGFEDIPDDVDAAFAIPALGHRGKEKVYFFKGEHYYQYEFKNQPSHAECVKMTQASPSVLFTRYTDLYCEPWEDLLTVLLGGSKGHQHSPRFINRDWEGIQPPVDAVMAGRIHISTASTPALAPSRFSRSRSSRRRHKNRRRGKKNQRKQLYSDLYRELYDYFEDIFPDYEMEAKSMPVQKIYFFKKDKYYRVDLQTKTVDSTNPPYPRPIAKYWLGCKDEPEHEKE
ncbi:vitronectin-like [Scleropages formosus]|uniref:Vitronectin b n=1 Tax=Scleropages formosus TaxID=113540 RepID=A0A8C9R7G2_SCLFO|nr:vitronectin-like [Scleropages formosus]